MHSRLPRRLLVAIALISLVLPVIPGAARTVGFEENPFLWDDPVPVKRKVKRHRPPPQKSVEKAPLLTVKWQLLSRGAGNFGEPLDMRQPVETGRQVKLAITPNQSGFLYVVHHSKGTDGATVDPPQLIFPDPRVNSGKNEVRKDEKYIVPGFCPEYSDPLDCWWEITPPDGKEYFTLIFSRSPINTLPNSGAALGDWIKQETLDDIRATSQLKDLKRTNRITVKSKQTEESDGTYVQNVNRNDNEEIFETIELTHTTPPEHGDDSGVRTRALFTKKRADAVSIMVLKDDEVVDPGRDFKEGEEIQIRLSSNFAGYVYVLNVTPSGKKRLLFPCSRRGDNRVAPWEDNILPSKSGSLAFDSDQGTEVLMVVLSHDRIGYLDDALKSCCPGQTGADCCGHFVCDLADSAAAAAAELAGNVSDEQRAGVVIDRGRENAGVRTRGVTLAAGRDRKRITTYVAVQDQSGGRLDPGKPAVFYIRLKHV